MRFLSVSLCLAICQISLAMDNFVYEHPANPYYYPEKFLTDLFPREKPIAELSKMRDVPSAGIVRLKGFKPTDLDVAKPVALDAPTVVKGPETAALKDISSERTVSAAFADTDLLGNLKVSEMNTGKEDVGMEQMEEESGSASLEKMVQEEAEIGRKMEVEQEKSMNAQKESIKSQMEKTRKFADNVNFGASKGFVEEDNVKFIRKVGSKSGEEIMELEKIRTSEAQKERVNQLGTKPSSNGRVVTLSNAERTRPRSNRRSDLKLVTLSGTSNFKGSKSRANRMVYGSAKYVKIDKLGSNSAKGKDFDPWEKNFKQ